MNQKFYYTENLFGELFLPGDKSISHRAVMFAAMADGESVIKNCSKAEDVRSTILCFKNLGVEFEESEELIKINGRGFKNFHKPSNELNAGNSGTTARLISGILCAQNFDSKIIGDASLSKRPMNRIVEPLRLMGANIVARNGTLPLYISPSNNLHAINYKLNIASAQVKSAIILAALHIDEISTIVETIPTRNHTETLLKLKTENTDEGKLIFVSRENYPDKINIIIPSDISSAAFFIILGLLTKNSNILIKNISLNETRLGIIKILKSMGANIYIENESSENNEPRGDIRVMSSQLYNVEIPEDLIPNIIDEIPILSIAGIFAEGYFKIKNAKELRVKESDRIKALCENFKSLGLFVNEYEDGFEIRGKINVKQPIFESYFDHRIAMSFAVLSMLLKDGGEVKNFDCVSISNPDFLKQLESIGYNSRI